MKKVSVLLFCIYTLLSCKPSGELPSDLIRNLNPTAEPIESSPVYAHAELIKLETSASCLLQGIRQVEMNDSCIFVQDFNNLYSFARDGKFIAQIGKRGEGPDEFIMLSAFYVDNNKRQITIIDNYKNRLINYDFAGKYLSATSVPKNSFESCNYSLLMNDNRLFVYSMMGMTDNKPYSIFDLNKNDISDSFFSYQPITLDNHMYSFSMHPMTKTDDDVDLILPLCDTIYSYSSATATFYPKYIVELPQKMIAKDQIRKKTPSYSEDIYNLSQQGYFPGFISIFETNEKILLGYKHQGVALAYFLFDKDKKAGNYYLISRQNNAIETLPFSLIVNTYKNSFIGSLDAATLMQFKSIKDEKMKATIESLKEDDNPCLVLYEFE